MGGVCRRERGPESDPEPRAGERGTYWSRDLRGPREVGLQGTSPDEVRREEDVRRVRRIDPRREGVEGYGAPERVEVGVTVEGGSGQRRRFGR